MESRTRRLARLARLLDQRKTSLEAQRTALDFQARQIEDEKRMLLETVDASIAAHGLFVDLLAGRMKRLEVETCRVERQAAALAVRMREDARRVRLVERLQAGAGRDGAREQEKRELADMIDARRTTQATCFDAKQRA